MISKLLSGLLLALPMCALADEPPYPIRAPRTYVEGQPSPHPLAKPLPDAARLGPAPRAFAQPSGVELVKNGGFEVPGLKPNSWKALPQIPGWRLLSGPAIEVQNRVAGAPFEGAQFVELDSHSSSGISQVVLTRAGAVYTLSFAFSGRPGTQKADNRVMVLWGDQVVAEVDGAPGQWRVHTYTVKGQGGSTRLAFVDLGVSNGLGSYLDAVSLRAAR